MALHWDISKVADSKNVCFHNYDKNELDSRFVVFVKMMMAMHVGRITIKNVEMVYLRLRSLEIIYGPFIFVNVDGDLLPDFYSLEYIKKLVGLGTNVSDKSDAFFEKEISRQVLWKAKESLESELRKEKEKSNVETRVSGVGVQAG